MNALGYRRVMFAVDDVDETRARLTKRGARLLSSEVVRCEDIYSGGLLVGLAEGLS